MVYLYAIHNVENKCNNKIYSFLSILSEERRNKIEKNIYPVSQQQCILGESLLRYILWKHYGMRSNEISFTYNEYGKPALINPKEVYFNISHSGDWIVCGISNTPIGVDVEKGVNETMSIAKRFFTKEEYIYINSQLRCNQHDAFCKIWTLKESYIKCVGKGLSIPLDSFRFEFSDNEIRMYKNNILDTNYIFRNKKLDDKYCVSLCILGKKCVIWHNNIHIISLNDLLVWKNEQSSILRELS